MKKMLILAPMIGLLVGCGDQNQGTTDTISTGTDRYGTNSLRTDTNLPPTEPTTPPTTPSVTPTPTPPPTTPATPPTTTP